MFCRILTTWAIWIVVCFTVFPPLWGRDTGILHKLHLRLQSTRATMIEMFLWPGISIPVLMGPMCKEQNLFNKTPTWCNVALDLNQHWMPYHLVKGYLNSDLMPKGYIQKNNPGDPPDACQKWGIIDCNRTSHFPQKTAATWPTKYWYCDALRINLQKISLSLIQSHGIITQKLQIALIAPVIGQVCLLGNFWRFWIVSNLCTKSKSRLKVADVLHYVDMDFTTIKRSSGLFLYPDSFL